MLSRAAALRQLRGFYRLFRCWIIGRSRKPTKGKQSQRSRYCNQHMPPPWWLTHVMEASYLLSTVTLESCVKVDCLEWLLKLHWSCCCCCCWKLWVEKVSWIKETSTTAGAGWLYQSFQSFSKIAVGPTDFRWMLRLNEKNIPIIFKKRHVLIPPKASPPVEVKMLYFCLSFHKLTSLTSLSRDSN